MPKHTTEYVKKELKKSGFITKKEFNYLGTEHRITIKCIICKNICKTRNYRSLKNYGCLECKKIKRFNKLKKDLKAINFKYISGYYKDCFSRIKTKCLICNNIIEKKIIDFFRNGCNNCNKNKINKKYEIKVKRKIKNIGSIIIDENWKYENSQSKIKLKCVICGENWNPCWDTLKQNHGCPGCYGNKKPSSDYVRKFIESKGGILNHDWFYKNCYTLIRIKCSKCNTVWYSSWDNISHNHWCPGCKNKTERLVIQIIKKIFRNCNLPIKYKQKKTFWNLRGKKQRALRFDYIFKIKSYIICVEYQGEQHYNKNNYHHIKHKNPEESWKTLKENDRKKRDFCKKKGYILIEIPYTFNEVDIKKRILINLFSELQIPYILNKF